MSRALGGLTAGAAVLSLVGPVRSRAPAALLYTVPDWCLWAGVALGWSETILPAAAHLCLMTAWGGGGCRRGSRASLRSLNAFRVARHPVGLSVMLLAVGAAVGGGSLVVVAVLSLASALVACRGQEAAASAWT